MRNFPTRFFFLAAATIATLGLSSCASETPQAGSTPNPEPEVLNVYATTGYLADTVSNIAPDAEITTMVGPGGDPHTFQPSTKDIEVIQAADVVFWNGLYLEAHMVDQLTSLEDKQLAVGEQIPEEMLLSWPETDDEGNELFDPHIWNSPEAWLLVVDQVADKLGEIDPANADEYRTNAEGYKDEINQTAETAAELLADVAEPRIVVTGHDAFGYFGETFELEVHATDFISSDAQLSPRELSDLADMIADNEVPVIFQDNQANPQAITSLQEAVRSRGWEVEVSDEELYADSLGAEPGVDTYLGVFEHNATVVSEALGQD